MRSENNIQRAIDVNEKARILVVCPYNKREDWQSDIRRQLGRYAHIVEQGDDGAMYEGDLKKVSLRTMSILFLSQVRSRDRIKTDPIPL